MDNYIELARVLEKVKEDVDGAFQILRRRLDIFTARAVESGAGSLSAVHRVDLADRRFNALSRVA